MYLLFLRAQSFGCLHDASSTDREHQSRGANGSANAPCAEIWKKYHTYAILQRAEANLWTKAHYEDWEPCDEVELVSDWAMEVHGVRKLCVVVAVSCSQCWRAALVDKGSKASCATLAGGHGTASRVLGGACCVMATCCTACEGQCMMRTQSHKHHTGIKAVAAAAGGAEHVAPECGAHLEEACPVHGPRLHVMVPGQQGPSS
jgi:hypothetical protein